MSFIHTAELNGVKPFDYLTELLRHTPAGTAPSVSSRGSDADLTGFG
jgi:hypothetical protein